MDQADGRPSPPEGGKVGETVLDIDHDVRIVASACTDDGCSQVLRIGPSRLHHRIASFRDRTAAHEGYVVTSVLES